MNLTRNDSRRNSFIDLYTKDYFRAAGFIYHRTKDILAKHGIALVFLPHLKGSSLQGATFMDGNRIVVGLVTEEKDAEKIRFNLFHELAHIVLGHVGKTGGTSEEEEKAADEWAAEKLTGVLTG